MNATKHGVGSNQYKTRTGNTPVTASRSAHASTVAAVTTPDRWEPPRGLPRPRNDNGFPVPYVAERPAELASIDRERWIEVASLGLCQVCGEPTTSEDRYAIIDRTVDLVQHQQLEWRPVVSGGPLHQRCLRIAEANGPHLRDEDHIVYRVGEDAYRPLNLDSVEGVDFFDYDEGVNIRLEDCVAVPPTG